VVTALSAAGRPILLLAELMTQGQSTWGSSDRCAAPAIATLHGAGQLAHAGDGDLARMRAEVTSKGGTTEAAVKSLESADMRGIVARALRLRPAAAENSPSNSDPLDETT